MPAASFPPAGALRRFFEGRTEDAGMTRFDASTPEDRRSLVADAIAAHRERGSVFCTVEAHVTPPEQSTAGGEAPDESTTNADGTARDDPAAEPEPAPAWIQFSDPESRLNLDCTDEEYDRITDVLSTAGAFTIDEQTAPEDAEGRNLRITAHADDDDRIAQVVDRIFVEGFGYHEEYRLWVTEI